MDQKSLKLYADIVADMREKGTYKSERVLITPQGKRISTTAASNVINMCSNNYLGLCDNSEVLAAAREL